MSAASENRLPAGLESIPAWRKTGGGYPHNGCHFDLWLDADQLLPAVRRLFDHGYFIEDIAGVDVQEGIMLVYHFDRYEAAQRVALRLMVPHSAKKAPSISETLVAMGVLPERRYGMRDPDPFPGVLSFVPDP